MNQTTVLTIAVTSVKHGALWIQPTWSRIWVLYRACILLSSI